MPINTSGTSLQGPSNANADAGGSYAAQVTGDSDTGSQIASNYSNGKATVDTTYQSTGGDLKNMIACCTAVMNGFAIMGSSNATEAEKEAALESIEEGVAGATIFVEGLAIAGIELGLIAAGSTLLTIPVVGWIAGVVLLVAAVLLSLVKDTFASANPPTWTAQDQVNQTIISWHSKFPTQALPGAPFTDQSRTLASLLASYVQGQLATSGDERAQKTLAMVTAPSKGFGYQMDDPGDVHTQISGLLGSASRADAVISMVSPLWNAAWGGTGATYDPYLGVAMDLDPKASPNILTPIDTALKPMATTDLTGLSASDYLCELAAAAYLANIPRAAGAVYAMIYLRLVQVAWMFKTSSPGPGQPEVVPVPDAINATLGYLLDLTAQNNALVTDAVLTQQAVSVQQAIPAGYTIAANPADRPLSYWVTYYLALGGAS